MVCRSHADNNMEPVALPTLVIRESLLCSLMNVIQNLAQVRISIDNGMDQETAAVPYRHEYGESMTSTQIELISVNIQH